MGPCCPLIKVGAGAPYLLWVFILFCIVALVKILKALNKISKLLEKK